MLSSFSLFALAETVMLDRSQPSFDEETEYKLSDLFENTAVRYSVVKEEGVLSLYDDNGNKMIKMALKKEASLKNNYATMTMFLHRGLNTYLKKGIIIDLDLIAPESGTIVLHTRGPTYYPNAFLKIENQITWGRNYI